MREVSESSSAIGKTAWTSVQSVARPVLNTGQHNKRKTKTDIFVPSGIRSHDSGIQTAKARLLTITYYN